MSRGVKTLVLILVVGITVLIVGGLFINSPVSKTDSNTVKVDIPQSSTTDDIGNILYEKGLIKSKLAFKILTKVKKVDTNFGVGTYELSKNMKLNQIINSIASGMESDEYKLVVPEGSEIKQITETLKELNMKNTDEFIKLTKQPEKYISEYPFLKDIPKGYSLEGYLYPSTYFLTEEQVQDPDAIIRMMLDNFQKHFSKEIQKSGKEKNLDINQLVTLASLVEREAQVDSDRPLISAVFHNRLKEDMYLQSCASVQYIIGERKPVLSVEDTQIDSPYNTYQKGGLPPAPIASPGIKSLKAAAHPADVDYLFFIAKGDGTHIFSSTFEEHLETQKKIQNN